MDGRRRPWLGILALGLALFGCGSDEPEPSDSDAEARAPLEVAVTGRFDGGSTALRVGQVLRLELPANPASGCAWQVESVDESVLHVPDMEEYLPPDPDSRTEAGTSVWRFAARGSGTTILKLRYACVPDDEKRPESTFSFTVIVD